MSQTLRYLRTLLSELGARPAPEPLALPLLPPPPGELRPADQGTVETPARPYSFYLNTAAQAYLLGEVAQAEGAPLPITLLSLAVGVIARSGSSLAPFLKPVYGHVVVLPANLGEAIEIDRYRGVGITPILASDPTTSRTAMLAAQLQAMAEMVEDTKESVFLAWHEAAGAAGHQILIEGSLHPTQTVLGLGSWTGIRPVTALSSLEEQAALGLPIGAAGVPFGFHLSGGYWFTRLAVAARPDSAEGLLRLETAFVNDEHVGSKVTALTRAVIHDRFPVVEPAATTVPLYPLRRTRAYLSTYITAPEAVVQAL